nr:MAG: hypothetical protein DIU73_01950 [Actinomycetota bacterium]
MGWGQFIKAVVKGEHKLATGTWITGIAAAIYAISPIDIISELVLGPLGLADDAGFVAIALALLVREKGRFEAQLAAKRADADIIDVEPL